MLQRNLTIFYFLFLLCQNVAGSSGNNKLSSEFKDDISNHPHPKKPRYGSPLSAVIRITPRDNVQDEQGLTGNGFIKGEAINMRSVPTVSSTYTSSHSMNTYQQADNLVKSRGTVNRNANQKAVHYRSKSSFSAAPKVKLEDKSATNKNIKIEYADTMRKIISTDPFTHIIGNDDFMDAFENCNFGSMDMRQEPNRAVKKINIADLPNLNIEDLQAFIDIHSQDQCEKDAIVLILEQIIKTQRLNEADFPLMVTVSSFMLEDQYIYEIPKKSDDQISGLMAVIQRMKNDCQLDCDLCCLCNTMVPTRRWWNHMGLDHTKFTNRTGN